MGASATGAAAAGFASVEGAVFLGTSGWDGTVAGAAAGAGEAGFSAAGGAACCAALAAAESGRAMVEDRMAGSIGAPGTLA